MHDDQLPLLIAFMVFTIVATAGLLAIVGKWMKRRDKYMDQ